MLEEVEYGSKKSHKRDLVIVILAYIIFMFILPILLNRFLDVRVFATASAWQAEGNVNLAFIILTLSEFFIAFIVGLITHKGNIYELLIICSFLIKFVLYVFASIIVFWFFRGLISDFNIFLVRLVVSFYAFKGVFFASTIFCVPTLLGDQFSKLIKNKRKEKK